MSGKATTLAILNCPDPAAHGNPYRYCPYCPWREESPIVVDTTYTLAEVERMGWLPPGLAPAPGSVILPVSDVEKVREALLMRGCERHETPDGYFHEPDRCRKCLAVALLDGRPAARGGSTGPA